MRTSMRKWLGIGLATALVSGIATTATSDAEASQVKAMGKGTAGGALLGAEVGFLGLSAFGARSGWLYGTVPTALAIGGGIGGYYLDKSIGDTGDAKPVMYMLAGGMLLVVPTIVITLSATATTYTSEDVPAADGGVKAAPAGGGGEGTTVTAPEKTSLRHVEPIRPAIPPSFALVNFDQQISPRMSLPAVEVSPMYSSVELSKFGGQQRWQFNAPLVAVTF
jgi:hypothetical protein